jgi:prevent-host-death family protein
MHRRIFTVHAPTGVITTPPLHQQIGFGAIWIFDLIFTVVGPVTTEAALKACRSSIIVGNITTRRMPTMEQAVSAADANRKFSLILRSVREGHSYIVTSHGRPVARIVPVDGHERVATGARAALLARLEKQPVVHAGRWTREELYEDER